MQNSKRLFPICLARIAVTFQNEVLLLYAVVDTKTTACTSKESLINLSLYLCSWLIVAHLGAAVFLFPFYGSFGCYCWAQETGVLCKLLEIFKQNLGHPVPCWMFAKIN
uniref:Uncharacterized protein n=1 Tax=Glossina brevipalpis TaxID=37001 RepID=A0A1A9WFS5_9MUSC